MSLLDAIKKKVKKTPEADKSAKALSVPETKSVRKSARPNVPSGTGRMKESVKKEASVQSGTSVQSKKYVYDMLEHPYITEKTSAMKANGNKYVFIVAKMANKPELRKAIQEKYKITVIKINMINIPSRKVMVGKNLGTKTGFRKAIITLKAGDSIEIGV